MSTGVLEDKRWSFDDQIFRVGSGQSSDFKTSLPVLEGRLFLLSTTSTPVSKAQAFYVTLNKKLLYVPFCADFGPLNLGVTLHVSSVFRNLLLRSEYKTTKLIYYCSTDPKDITNAMYLLGSFLCLYLGCSPEAAWKPFAGLSSQCLPYRDATWAKSTFDLLLTDCWAGLLRAVSTGLLDLQSFDKNEYFYYDDPANGEFHEVVKGKFIAFKGPCDQKEEFDDGTCTLSATDFVHVFGSKNVTDIVRLNSREYNERTFRNNGFQHHDLFFEDCTAPSDVIIHDFLKICEKAKGVVAVHCLAGLGRTGTLIALYMMKHYFFTAHEAIAWLRICRPGSVIGPQQKYLVSMQDRMHQCGRKGVSGLGEVGVYQHIPVQRTASAAQYSLLPEMVTDGMNHRARIRAGLNGKKLACNGGVDNCSDKAEAGAGPVMRTSSAPRSAGTPNIEDTERERARWEETDKNHTQSFQERKLSLPHVKTSPIHRSTSDSNLQAAAAQAEAIRRISCSDLPMTRTKTNLSSPPVTPKIPQASIQISPNSSRRLFLMSRSGPKQSPSPVKQDVVSPRQPGAVKQDAVSPRQLRVKIPSAN